MTYAGRRLAYAVRPMASVPVVCWVVVCPCARITLKPKSTVSEALYLNDKWQADARFLQPGSRSQCTVSAQSMHSQCNSQCKSQCNSQCNSRCAVNTHAHKRIDTHIDTHVCTRVSALVRNICLQTFLCTCLRARLCTRLRACLYACLHRRVTHMSLTQAVWKMRVGSTSSARGSGCAQCGVCKLVHGHVCGCVDMCRDMCVDMCAHPMAQCVACLRVCLNTPVYT